MGNPLSSWNGQIPTDVLLDSGILYIAGSIFSAQEGELKFNPGKTIREIDFAGRRSRVKNLDRTTMWKPVISGTLLELPLANFGVLEPGASVPATIAGGPAGASQILPKTAGVLYAPGDYIAAPRAVWQRTDGTYFQIRFYGGGLVTKWDIAGTDKQEAKWAIEIEAVLDMTISGAKVTDCPFVGEYFSVQP